MKKIISVFLSALMVCSVLSVSAFAAETPREGTSSEPVLRLEYMEFYNNQDYYMDLVREEGYCLYIDVNEEYREMELARITEGTEKINELTAPVTRGSSVPNKEWNIVQKGKYSFRVDTASTQVFTNYYFTGASTYVVTMTNISNVVPAGGCAYNTVTGTSPFGGSSGTVIKRFAARSSSAHFYMHFSAPSYIIGSIEKS